MPKKVVVLLLCVLFTANLSWGQSPPKLGLIFSDIYGAQGLLVNSEVPLVTGEPHYPHFNNAFQRSFSAFNTALGSQLAAVPLPSPASGFTYKFNSDTGAFTRSTQSFGPILADRAETLGRGKVSASFNYQYFNFKSIEGVDLTSVPAVFTHDPDDTGQRTGGRLDVITTQNSIKVSVNQFTAFFNYGVAERMDVSVAIPIVRTSLSLTSDATIRRLGTTDPRVHFFFPDPVANGPAGSYGNTRHFPIPGTSASGTASGIGDVVFRAKANVMRREESALAVGMDFRAPTGDVNNLLGSGAPGVKPFAALTLTHGKVAPHVNLGYQWNGNSVLAGSVATGTKKKLPDQFLYTAGFDIGVTNKVTFAFDTLGQAVRNAPRLVSSNDSFPCGGGLDCGPSNSPQVFPNINFIDENYNIVNGAVGFKVSPTEHFLIGVNALFRMNKAGLRSNVTPLVGLEYSF
jgi:hypothetical protein